MLYVNKNHEKLTDNAWSKERAQTKLSELFNVTCQKFDPEQLWPTHPLDPAQSIVVPRTSFYSGAAGTILALNHIAKFLDKKEQMPDFCRSCSVIEDCFASFEQAFAKIVPVSQPFSGYLSGYCGLYLFQYWFGKDDAYDEFIVMASQAFDTNHENELLLGLPGILLASVFLHQLKQSRQLEGLIDKLITKLLDSWQYCESVGCYLWQQDLYGEKTFQLGFIHGFAGNVFALLKARSFMSKELLEKTLERAYTVLIKLQDTQQGLTNFSQSVIKHRKDRGDYLLQLCHGAPGFIYLLHEMLAIKGGSSDDMYKLAVFLGDTIWQAGPLVKPNGLCHGNAGSGFAFLKMYDITGDNLWLDRAKSFAMHAIEQQEAAELKYEMPRFGYVTGDLGLAMFMMGCLQGRPDGGVMLFDWFSQA